MLASIIKLEKTSKEQYPDVENMLISCCRCALLIVKQIKINNSHVPSRCKQAHHQENSVVTSVGNHSNAKHNANTKTFGN